MDLNIILNRKRPGDTVTLTVYRGGKKLDIPVKLGERSDGTVAQTILREQAATVILQRSMRQSVA